MTAVFEQTDRACRSLQEKGEETQVFLGGVAQLAAQHKVIAAIERALSTTWGNVIECNETFGDNTLAVCAHRTMGGD